MFGLKREAAFKKGSAKKEQFKQSDHKKEDEMGRCPRATGTHVRGRFVEINKRRSRRKKKRERNGLETASITASQKCARAQLNCTVQISGKPAPLSGNGVGGGERVCVNLTLPLGLYWKVQYLIRRWELSKNELKPDPT